MNIVVVAEAGLHTNQVRVIMIKAKIRYCIINFIMMEKIMNLDIRKNKFIY